MARSQHMLDLFLNSNTCLTYIKQKNNTPQKYDDEIVRTNLSLLDPKFMFLILQTKRLFWKHGKREKCDYHT